MEEKPHRMPYNINFKKVHIERTCRTNRERDAR